VTLATSAPAICACFFVVALSARQSTAAAQETDGGALDRVLQRALKLLPPSAVVPVRFVDPELIAEPDAIRRVDAFTVRDPDGRIRPVVYLNPRSAIVRLAKRGDDLHVGAMAAVIQHELAHLRGATEAEARVAEREFFRQLIYDGHVPSASGLACLTALQQEHRTHGR
jgi:hypothetical protein